MTIRSWLAAALAVTVISLSAGQSYADSRSNFERVEREQPARAQAARIAQPRPGRMDRAQAAPSPSRAKQVQRLEPKPAPQAARQRGNSDDAQLRAGRASRR